MLGALRDQNLYLTSGDRWNAKYIPAFIRRYPFVFSSSADRKTLTLCIDESHPGFNREGRGSRLFGDDAKPTPYVDKVLTFLKEFQGHLERTRLFGRRLKELQLLQPMQANVTTPSGEQITMGSFLAVNREKLRALDGATLEKLARNDELELLYLHLASMGNFNEVKDRLIGTGADKGAPTADAASAEADAADVPGGEEKAAPGWQRSRRKAPADG
ncbi:SapC family protein [Accumulibacter sp.]|uniref:SapC family protein n=1 Tax=Accumulibacter sp. TaxID=2053492 RepID=UPI0025E37F2F|nr:SapC family protein [Accumulibacter sp.]MCP5230389.1 SapC family protein [Accumulibacter sp.]